ncbi:MAG: HlyD family type I secretion periplasmic adaptor subunit [Desulfovibrio sp.]|nr:HlyD family type I secretion periplasmic adaptor subunit [Desulfovibrio sp.]
MQDLDPEAIAFLPDALAIREEQLPGWARYGILWIAGFILLSLLFACIAQVDVIVSAKGKIVSDHPTVVMKPLERTVLKGIHVAIGDRVRKGQVLATFDTVFSLSDRDRLASLARLHEARHHRLLAEFAAKPYTLPPHPTDEERVQETVYRDRERYFRERNAFFHNDIKRIEKSMHSVAENLKIQQERLKGFKAIEGIVNRGHATGATSHREFIESQNARRAMEAEIGDKENAILVLESELLARKAEYEAFLREWRVQLAEDLTRTESALIETRKELQKAERMTTYVELRAPENAMVHDIASVSIGSAIREAETLITLIPLDGAYEVEAEIRADDIGKVHEGMDVRIKVSAFPFQQYGVLHGRIRVIAEDAMPKTEDQRQHEPVSFYRTRITLDPKDAATVSYFTRLIPGMDVQAEIIVGQRRIIRYLVNPLVKSLDEAIREP